MATKLFNMDILDKDLMKEIDEYIDSLEDKKGNIIHILHKAQEVFGYLPKELQLYISRQVDLPAAKVNGIVSFYSFFSQEPSGKYAISVCMGTACFVKGSDVVLTEFKNRLGLNDKKVTDDLKFSIRDVRCIGACGLAPVVVVNEKIYGHVSTKDIPKIIKEYKDLEA